MMIGLIGIGIYEGFIGITMKNVQLVRSFLNTLLLVGTLYCSR